MRRFFSGTVFGSALSLGGFAIILEYNIREGIISNDSFLKRARMVHRLLSGEQNDRIESLAFQSRSVSVELLALILDEDQPRMNPDISIHSLNLFPLVADKLVGFNIKKPVIHYDKVLGLKKMEELLSLNSRCKLPLVLYKYSNNKSSSKFSGPVIHYDKVLGLKKMEELLSLNSRCKLPLFLYKYSNNKSSSKFSGTRNGTPTIQSPYEPPISDNKTFEEAVAVESLTIKHKIEDDCADTSISLPNITSKILAKVIEYCKKHVETPKSEDKANEEELKSFDADFVKVDQGTLFDLILLITKEEGLELYEDMFLGRTFEEMCDLMYKKGDKVFLFVHLYNGQEAVSTGFIKLLKKEDSVVSTYSDHVHALSKGVPPRAVMSELFGKTTGCCRGQGGSMHMFSQEHNLLGCFAFIGEGILVATGAAFTSKYKREVLKAADCDHVTLAFFGDGTCNNGQFFECLNMVALWKLPIVFVVENNLWAIGMSHLRATSDPEIWKKGSAFGMPGVHVDGMDVLKVREVAKEAIGRARRGEGLSLIECETYRFDGHSVADPDKLRDNAEKARYLERDPIKALKKYVIENNLASEGELKAIEKKIEEVVEEAVEFAGESPLPSRSQLLENVFADPRGFGIGPDGRCRCEDPKFT